MKYFYLKRIVCILLVLMSCSKSGVIEFCKEVDKEGNGQKCGTKFTTGELMIIINAESSFGSEKISVQKTDLNNSAYSEAKLIKVKPISVQANTDLSFYRAGKYKITAKKDKIIIAEGEIEIIDDDKE